MLHILVSVFFPCSFLFFWYQVFETQCDLHSQNISIQTNCISSCQYIHVVSGYYKGLWHFIDFLIN